MDETEVILKQLQRVEDKQDETLEKVSGVEKTVVGMEKDIKSNKDLGNEAKKLAIEGYYDRLSFKDRRVEVVAVLALFVVIIGVVITLIANIKG